MFPSQFCRHFCGRREGVATLIWRPMLRRLPGKSATTVGTGDWSSPAQKPPLPQSWARMIAFPSRERPRWDRHPPASQTMKAVVPIALIFDILNRRQCFRVEHRLTPGCEVHDGRDSIGRCHIKAKWQSDYWYASQTFRARTLKTHWQAKISRFLVAPSDAKT